MRTYKQGDTGIYHQTLNNAEAAYARVFGANPDGPGRRRVLINVPVDLPPFSVVQLGTKETPFGHVPVLELPDNLSEGRGPCYTNGDVPVAAGDTHWLDPIDEFPSMLIVDGDISTGDTASVTDAGEAKRGSGPLHCASEAEDGFAWFVRAFPQTVRIGKFDADLAIDTSGNNNDLASTRSSHSPSRDHRNDRRCLA